MLLFIFDVMFIMLLILLCYETRGVLQAGVGRRQVHSRAQLPVRD
jgi:hypothetical protein